VENDSLHQSIEIIGKKLFAMDFIEKRKCTLTGIIYIK
jgi:hypothetical protein